MSTNRDTLEAARAVLDTVSSISLEDGELTDEQVADIFAHEDVVGSEDTGCMWGHVTLTFGQMAALIRIERGEFAPALDLLARLTAPPDEARELAAAERLRLTKHGLSLALGEWSDSEVRPLAEDVDYLLAQLAAARAERDALRDERDSAVIRDAFGDREIDTLRCENERLRDLVRYQRGPLHEAGLLTDEEYAALAADSGAVARLEGYDTLRREVEGMRAALAKTVRIADELQAAGLGGPHVGLVAAPAAEALLPGNGAALGGTDAE